MSPRKKKNMSAYYIQTNYNNTAKGHHAPLYFNTVIVTFLLSRERINYTDMHFMAYHSARFIPIKNSKKGQQS